MVIKYEINQDISDVIHTNCLINYKPLKYMILFLRHYFDYFLYVHICKID